MRASKYEEEISDGHLGINEKELNSMNKHIPGNSQTELLMDFFRNERLPYLIEGEVDFVATMW